MLQEFNWIDGLIAVFLIISLVQGIRKGLIRSIFTFAGITAGLIAAMIFYARLSNLILAYVNLPQFIADSLSFIFLFALAAAVINAVGELFSLVTRLRFLRALDKLFGAGAGLVIGLAVVGVIFILLTAFPLFSGFQERIEESALAPSIIETTERLYTDFTAVLPFEIPSLTLHPEELAGYFNNARSVANYSIHHDIDFAALDGTACFVCDGPVDFLGFVNNDLGSHSPKFICSECKRTSDGCQTYAGYHQMYNQCPVKLGNRGYRFDCGIWTNGTYHRPTGPCPVCGTR